MEKEPNSDQQQSVPTEQNLQENTAQTVSQSIPQIIQQPLTPIQMNQPNQTHLLEYNMDVPDQQTSIALNLFKSIFNDKQQWNLSSKRKWIKLQLQTVFKNLSLALPKIIDLTQNQEPLFLDYLACVATFPCLKELMLCNNKISSFEKLTFIDFPVLEHLSLRDNDIAGIKCLNKMNFRPENIRKLSFYANRVQSLEPISRVNFVNANPKHKKTTKILKKEENLQQNLSLQREEHFYEEQREKISQEWKQEQLEEEQVQEEKALEPLSLLFGINQIGGMEEMNKLQRQVIKPREMKPYKMGDYWDNDSPFESFDPENYKQNRRLVFSIEMNKQSYDIKNRTVFNLKYNYFCRNYLPHDNIFS